MKSWLSAKYFRTAAAILFLAAGFCQAAQAEDTIYDVINREDTKAFSDMVMLGYDIDEQDIDGYTPLMIAAKNGHRFTVELLVRRGADVNFRNVKGETALDIANKYRYKEIARFLQNEGGRSKSPDSGKEASDGGNQGLGLDIDDWNDTEFDWGL